MFCPMKFNNPHFSRDEMSCEKSNVCAWWFPNKDMGYCAITSIAIDLDNINTSIERMRAY